VWQNHEFIMTHPANEQNTAYALPTAQCQRFSAYYGTAAIFKLSYFLCGLFPTLNSTLLFCLKHILF